MKRLVLLAVGFCGYVACAIAISGAIDLDDRATRWWFTGLVVGGPLLGAEVAILSASEYVKRKGS